MPGKAGQAVEKKYSAMPVPTLYIHGWHGNERSTDQLIESAEDEKGAKKVLKVKVSPQGATTYSGKWNSAVKHPLIQVVFENNEAEIPAIKSVRDCRNSFQSRDRLTA